MKKNEVMVLCAAITQALLWLLMLLTPVALAGGYTVGNPVSSLYTSLLNTGYNTQTETPLFLNIVNNPSAGQNSTTLTNGLSSFITTAGDPVNMATGNMVHTERDIMIKGRGGLAKVSWLDGTGAEKFFATGNHTNGNITLSSAIPDLSGIFVTFQRQADGSYALREKNGLTYKFESVTGPSGVRDKLPTKPDCHG